jgi:hypothetical protein
MLHSNVGSRWPKSPKADGRFEGKQNNITKQMNTTNWKTRQRVGGVGDKLCAKAVPVLEEIYQSLAAALSFWWVRLHFTAMVGSFSFFFFLLDFLSANPQRQISISMCI